MKAAIIIATLALAFFLYRKINPRPNKYQDETYLRYLDRLQRFLDKIKSFDDYVTWVVRDQIKNEYSDVDEFFRNKTKFYNEEEKVKTFNDIFYDFDQYIANYNLTYIATKKEKLREFFDDIEGKSIDNQQRNAVVTDEYSNLIVAGAGSGKTLTILAKVKYLVEIKGVNPKDILLLSFTTKTVEELNERLENLGLETRATTFHKLGNLTIRKFTQTPPAIAKEDVLSKIVSEYLKKDILEDSAATQSFIEYVACYMNIPEDFDKYDSLGDKLDTEKGVDLNTLKSKCEDLNIVRNRALDTLQGERVKSVEELTIANFLYLNGVDYEYEKRYNNADFVYQPDFYLTEHDIWLEHFGVDEKGNANHLTPHNRQLYAEQMQSKRETHKKHGTKLLETYSYYNRDKVLLSKLTAMLEENGIVLKPRDTTQIFAKVTENDPGFGKEIQKLIASFINLSKSRQLDSASIVNLLLDKRALKNNYMAERLKLFLQFALPILDKYDTRLADANEIDFNDMINKATELLKEHRPKLNYDYIIVDEYQDISFARFTFIKEIRELCEARLVCVGDDWQSIYRFAGSDISLFSNFERHVGKYEKLLIEQTYRNSQSIIDISSKFIKQNKKQIQKNPLSKKVFDSDPVKFVSFDEHSYQDTFVSQVKALVEVYGNKSILVLGRHSFDVNPLIKKTESNGHRIVYVEKTNELKIDGFKDLDIKFLTIHKSKGLEADNVIVLQMKNDLFGFPNKMTDDPILSLLLSDDEDFRFAEERRLFYVALTRTRNEAILLIPAEKSVFVDELLKDDRYLINSNQADVKPTNCPYCKTGKLVKRQNPNNGKYFLGCSHYPSCNQIFYNLDILGNAVLCKLCNSGFMVERHGNFKPFLGCTSYPKCRQTTEL